ncbi:hypothetical protein GW750_09510 [bacterium]|nr:hypothetical protein [bacterium]
MPEEYVSVFEDKFTTLEHTESNCILFSKLLYDLLQYDAVSQKNLLAYLSQQKLSNSIQNSDSYSIFC